MMRRWTYIVRMLDGTHLVFEGQPQPGNKVWRRAEWRLSQYSVPFDDGNIAVKVTSSNARRTALFREVLDVAR